MAALTPIDQVIRTLCLKMGDHDFRKYDSVALDVRGCINNLKIYTIPSVTTKPVKVNKVGNIQWPDSCITPLLIEVQRGECKCPVYIDRNVKSFNDTQKCDCPLTEAEQIIDDALCGRSECDHGFGKNVCSHNKEGRYSNLRYRLAKTDQVWFTFVSDGIGDGLTHVPVEAEMCVEEYVFWKQYRLSDKGVSGTAKVNYDQQFTALNKFYTNQSLEEWIAAMELY